MVVAFVSVLVLFHYKLLSNALALSIEHLLFVVSFMIWMLFVEKRNKDGLLMQITHRNIIMMQISHKKTTSQAKIHCNCHINLLVLSVFLLFRTFINGIVGIRWGDVHFVAWLAPSIVAAGSILLWLASDASAR